MAKQMMMEINELPPVTTLFLDIGGVMLSNGWGHVSRRLAAEVFNLNLSELEDTISLLSLMKKENLLLKNT
jgi:hypothetical protein